MCSAAPGTEPSWPSTKAIRKQGFKGQRAWGVDLLTYSFTRWVSLANQGVRRKNFKKATEHYIKEATCGHRDHRLMKLPLKEETGAKS